MRTRFETALAIEAYQGHCQDRAVVLEEGERVVIVVADGAGGSGNGAAAADTVIREVRQAYRESTSSDAWVRVLAGIDQRIGEGESTAVVVDLDPNRICGASVGDSQAWIVNEEIHNLTANQKRKPPAGFRAGGTHGF